MDLLLIFAEGDAAGIAVQGAVGVASLAIAGLFLKYIRERDAMAERAHKSCEETIQHVVNKHEEAVDKLTDSFRLELADERTKRDAERREFRESLHLLRNQAKPQ